MPPDQHITNIHEGQRQALLLALAQLSLDRPGLDFMLWELAEKWEPGVERASSLYERFRELHKDRIEPMKGWCGNNGRPIQQQTPAQDLFVTIVKREGPVTVTNAFRVTMEGPYDDVYVEAQLMSLKDPNTAIAVVPPKMVNRCESVADLCVQVIEAAEGKQPSQN